VKLSNIKPNPNNPRLIKDDKFNKLVQSIKDFPEMMEKRPIVCVTDVDGKIYPLGGNMRYKALKEIGYKDIPDSWVTMADDWTEEKRREFVIKDNVGFGEWDWEQLGNEWDAEELEAWGLDVPDFSSDNDENSNEAYTTKIEAPVYEPKNEKPKIDILYDVEKYKELISEIENSLVNEDIKVFLKVAASRHIVFNYENIADFYAHSEKEVQELMEKSALVIIDFNKAIELGFTKLNDEIASQYKSDYE
jgi:hypothetical protein